jgi:hypothetical protein
MLSNQSAQYGIVPQHGGAAAATARIRTRRRGSFDAASMETSCIGTHVSYDWSAKSDARNYGRTCCQPKSRSSAQASRIALSPQL